MHGNASALGTTLGGGARGNIRIIIPDALYPMHTATAYAVSLDPGLMEMVPGGGSTAEQGKCQADHDLRRRLFENHTNMDAALLSKIVDAFDKIYLNNMKHSCTGCLSVNARNLPDHLMGLYDTVYSL